MKISSTLSKNMRVYNLLVWDCSLPSSLVGEKCHFSIVKPEGTGSREQKSMPRVLVSISNKPSRKQTGKIQSPVRLGYGLIRVHCKPAKNVQRDTGNESIIKALDKLIIHPWPTRMLVSALRKLRRIHQKVKPEADLKMPEF